MSPETKLRHLKDLAAHPGWHLLAEKMREEMINVALESGRDPKQSLRTKAYLAGVLETSERCLLLPQNYITFIENEVALSQTTSPAAAGPENSNAE